MSFNDPDNGDIDDEDISTIGDQSYYHNQQDNGPDDWTKPPKKFYSVHTRDLPDEIYLAAHESLREDDDYCHYPELVAQVARALMKAAKAGK